MHLNELWYFFNESESPNIKRIIIINIVVIIAVVNILLVHHFPIICICLPTYIDILLIYQFTASQIKSH